MHVRRRVKCEIDGFASSMAQQICFVVYDDGGVNLIKKQQNLIVRGMRS